MRIGYLIFFWHQIKSNLRSNVYNNLIKCTFVKTVDRSIEANSKIIINPCFHWNKISNYLEYEIQFILCFVFILWWNEIAFFFRFLAHTFTLSPNQSFLAKLHWIEYYIFSFSLLGVVCPHTHNYCVCLLNGSIHSFRHPFYNSALCDFILSRHKFDQPY